MSTAERKRFNTPIYDEASVWLIEFRSGEVGSAERRRFVTWLRTSPEHVRAYVELAAIWNEGGKIDALRRIDTNELIEQALQQAKVTSLDLQDAAELGAPTRASATRAGSVGRRRSRVALPAAAAVVLTAAGLAVWLNAQRGVYSTDIGEQRSVTLPDGSEMNLNTNTRARVSFSAGLRSIELLRGEALFRVAKDPSRPFEVTSNTASVRAVGTQFDVDRRESGTIVSVIEGRVAVIQPAAPTDSGPQPEPDVVGGGPALPKPSAGALLLAAGEQAVVSATKAVKSSQPNISAATAWTQHSLVFESATLAEVAEQFNRYNPRRLVILSPELENFRITGTFSSTDPSSLLRFLQTRPGIVISYSDEAIQVSKRP